jgi:hypothetical protein
MKPPVILPSNDIRNDSKYVIIKTPRDSIQSSTIDSLISDVVGEKLKKGMVSTLFRFVDTWICTGVFITLLPLP